jgi:cardiolipin synthase A/B
MRAMLPVIDYAYAVALVIVAAIAAGHAVLYKRDSRSAALWVIVIWVLPAVGSILYYLLGINRVQRRAARLRGSLVRHRTQSQFPVSEPGTHFLPLARLVGTVVDRPLLDGNAIEVLIDGVQAYPAMLEAIGAARTSITLASYIFHADGIGARFVGALVEAQRRGVQVRVLIDDVGVRYSFPPVHWALRRAGVRVARFLPILSGRGVAFLNLRTHRKLMIVDGRLAFAGGMNIAAPNVHARAGRKAIRDMLVKIEGPVVRQLQDAFAEDWAFTTREVLEGRSWFPDVENRGSVSARAITNGPDSDFEVLRNVLLGALSSARESVRIVTPYFVPDAQTIAALGVCALRGVRIDIVLPSRGNIPLAQWASRAIVWQVLKPGCRVFLSPPPFEHTKLFVVDRTWALFGTTNWDTRSLRLNFELDVECYDREVAGRLDDMIAERIALSREYTMADADGRPFLARVRDGVARLFSPYL